MDVIGNVKYVFIHFGASTLLQGAINCANKFVSRDDIIVLTNCGKYNNCQQYNIDDYHSKEIDEFKN